MGHTVYLPIRGFRDAKHRLASTLDGHRRRALAEGLAGHTVAALREAGAEPIVISSSAEVASWASVLGLRRLPDPGAGLDGAAASAAAHATNGWLILHSDLPLIDHTDVETLVGLADQHPHVIAPSYDGGTTALSGLGPFSFRYGVSSFHRHLRSDSTVVVRPGLALDIDEPADLLAAQAHPKGRWLLDVLGPASG